MQSLAKTMQHMQEEVRGEGTDLVEVVRGGGEEGGGGGRYRG